MNVLLDNCMPYRAKTIFEGHAVSHAKDQGWERLENGRLLAAAAEARFAVMVTVDKKIKFEQNLELLPLTVIEIDTGDSRLPSIMAVAARMIEALGYVERFRFIRIDQDGQLYFLAERT